MDYNKCTFIGKVKGAPNVSADNSQVVLTVKVNDRAPDANGQYVDRYMDITAFTKDQKRVTAIANHVKDGQEVLIDAQYINWDSDGQTHHAFRILNIVFGYTPRQPQNNPGAGPNIPI
jgi:hypothetical protein